MSLQMTFASYIWAKYNEEKQWARILYKIALKLKVYRIL